MHREIYEHDPIMINMRGDGTNHLTKIMNDFDLLPVHNFRYGSHPDATKIYSPEFSKYFSLGHPRRLLVRLHPGLRQVRRGLRAATPGRTRVSW